MRDLVNRQLVLASRPTTTIEERHFDIHEALIPDLDDGQALVQVVWLGIEPTQRTWLNASATYTKPVAIGDVMRGPGVGRVIASKSDRFHLGDWVVGETGWQEYAIAESEGLFGFTRLPDGIDPKAMLSVYGVNGLTAYFGMTEIGKVQPGDTVFVSGAAGSVGSIAGQIARMKGARVIGSAGGQEKCAWVTKVAGFDACIDYLSADVRESIKELAPTGINVVFDNVGGAILEAALENLAVHARIVICGSISSGYRENAYGHTPRNYMQLGFRRARMEGFIFFDYAEKIPSAFADLHSWVSSRSIVYREDIAVGLEAAPLALQGLFEGRNRGKQLVRVSDDHFSSRSNPTV
jgi:NADPH-dependent curcumin reductase CurA